ncbi:MAG: aminoglycoside phosphotransferase family protein [Pyrinomonadaceae bacterium]
MLDCRQRLERYLEHAGEPIGEIEQLTPDASTREYFRVRWQGRTAIACVYPEPFDAAEQTYLDVTRLFAAGGLPVAQVLAYDERLGIIVQEDLGDLILRNKLVDADAAERDRLLDRSIALIARIQAATDLARQMNSAASRLKFDVEKLTWELDFFRTHYFETLRRRPLTAASSDALDREFRQLAGELEARAEVLCHRDFHAANLMIDRDGELRIIDHQDARIGTASYDLVSLLLDRVTEPPPVGWLGSKRRVLIEERVKLGLPRLDENRFAHEFRLQTVQRCLKAVGTFSFQSAMRGKTHFLPFIKPMFEIALRAASEIESFPALGDLLLREIETDQHPRG